MSKYLIAGSAGFIAGRVAEMLLEDGHSVIGLDNLNDAYDVRMKEYRLSQLEKFPEFTFIKQDIADKDAILALQPQVEGAAAVINLAARAGVRPSVENPWIYVDTNLIGSLNLLELSRRSGIPKIVLASTSTVYGEDPPIPTPETVEIDRPMQPYAATKVASEAMAYAYHYLYNLDVTIVRYFNVYGPAGRPDMAMYRFSKWIIENEAIKVFGDGNQTRGFTYIDDIALGTIQALRPMGFEAINLGGHESISMNELIALIEELTGTPANIDYLKMHKADFQANLADTGKAFELLNWQPQVGLREGVARMIDWYMENRQWAKDITTL